MENQHETMTEEELKARKNEMLSFYKDSMPYIKAQLAYEKILTEIEEQRFKRASYQMQWAMMMQEPEEERLKTEKPISNSKSNAENKPKRKLKTE